MRYRSTGASRSSLPCCTSRMTPKRSRTSRSSRPERPCPASPRCRAPCSPARSPRPRWAPVADDRTAAPGTSKRGQPAVDVQVLLEAAFAPRAGRCAGDVPASRHKATPMAPSTTPRPLRPLERPRAAAPCRTTSGAPGVRAFQLLRCCARMLAVPARVRRDPLSLPRRPPAWGATRPLEVRPAPPSPLPPPPPSPPARHSGGA